MDKEQLAELERKLSLRPIDIMVSNILTDYSKEILLETFYPEANEIWQRIKSKIGD